MSSAHEQRIINELRSVGVTHHGLAKPESKELSRILHNDEHIGGVIYGRGETGSSAMLVATDRRVLFIDSQFLFKTTDELSYDVVSGVSSSTAGPLISVTLHTRITDYALRYVNAKCANIFIEYIEKKSLEKDITVSDVQTSSSPASQSDINSQTQDFLKSHNLAVLSTVDRTGNVYGALVYYIVDEHNVIYLLTKSDTNKGKNIYAHSQVAMTIHEPDTLKTLQLQGDATVVTDQTIKENVLVRLTQPRKYRDGLHQPPVTGLQDGAFMVIRITPSRVSYHDYSIDQ